MMTRFRRGNTQAGDGDSGSVSVQVGADADDTTRHGPTAWSNSYNAAWGPGNHSGEASPNRHQSFLFANITVPQGATIDVATFEPYMLVIGTDGGQDTNVYAEDADNPIAPTSAANFDARALTTAFTPWDDVDYSEGFTESPSIADVIKEVVDRGSWSSGNALQIIWKDDGSLDDEYPYVQMHDGSAGNAAKLNIEWST